MTPRTEPAKGRGWNIAPPTEPEPTLEEAAEEAKEEADG